MLDCAHRRFARGDDPVVRRFEVLGIVNTFDMHVESRHVADRLHGFWDPWLVNNPGGVKTYLSIRTLRIGGICCALDTDMQFIANYLDGRAQSLGLLGAPRRNLIRFGWPRRAAGLSAGAVSQAPGVATAGRVHQHVGGRATGNGLR